MAESKVNICNKGLSLLGVDADIQNLESEQSSEARACKLFFDQALETTLRGFDWPFARRYKVLEFVEENPILGWAASYRYPAKCVKLLGIIQPNLTPTKEAQVNYILSSDDAGQLVLTNQGLGTVKYTALITNPALYPSDFSAALSARLAYYIAPRVTGGDPFSNQDKAMKLFNLEMAAARTSAVNEENPPELFESEFILVRS